MGPCGIDSTGPFMFPVPRRLAMRSSRHLSRVLWLRPRYPLLLSHVRAGIRSGSIGQRRIAGWLSLSSAALLLLSILIGGSHAGVVASAPTHPATGASGHWTNLFPALRAISAVAPTEFWAAGEGGH